MNIHDTIGFQNIGLPDDILRRKLHGDFAGLCGSLTGGWLKARQPRP